MCVIADDKLQRVKVMFLLTLLLQINCLQFYIKHYIFIFIFFLSGLKLNKLTKCLHAVTTILQHARVCCIFTVQL